LREEAGCLAVEVAQLAAELEALVWGFGIGVSGLRIRI